MDIDKILDGLNESQRLAVTAQDRAVLVIAGPGTGKTMTIVRRIVYLLYQGVRPEDIVAITFTNRAGLELRNRLRVISDFKGLFTGTFHMLGLKVIRDNTLEPFKIITREEQKVIIKNITGRVRSGDIIERISAIKNFLLTPDKKTGEIFNRYQEILKKEGALDYDDLILKALELLSIPEIQRIYTRPELHLIIDEYQDINLLQYRLIKALSPQNIYAVGDPDQSIYSFRGANVENFLNFEKDYPSAKRFILDTNYRSQAFVVKASEFLIEKNTKRIPRVIKALKGEDKKIKVVSVPDEDGEVQFIINTIEEKLGGTSHYNLFKTSHGMSQKRGLSFSDMAVLMRTNLQAYQMESSLKASGIPCYIMGRSINEEVKEALSYIKENQNKTLEELIYYLKEKYNFFRSLIQNYEPSSTDDLISWLNLVLPQDDTFSGEAVRLLTMHMAKGLEFRIVFITGLEEGLMPYKESEIEEERRLLYVSMTRAKEELYLIHSRKRKIYGRLLEQKPSPFLQEIPEDFIERIYLPDKPQKRQLGLFSLPS
jgi:DNA helicase-2/ATP-dependent DNA helicase PcrA